MATRALQAFLAVAALYFIGTGYAGYLVGKGINDAKHRNLIAAIGTSIIGRNATERLALRQAHLPRLVTQSPTFWMMLRENE